MFCFADAISGGVQPTINALLVNAPVGTHNLTIVPQLVNGSTSRVFDNAGVSAPISPITNATPTVVIGGTCIPTAVTMSGFEHH